MKVISSLVFSVAFFAPRDLSAAGAVELVQRSVDRALEILRDPKLQGPENRDERHRRLRAVSDEIFDWGAMARRSLGVHWRNIGEEQRRRFIAVFEETLADYYLAQIDRFQGREQVELVGSSRTPAGTEVRMKLITQSREEIPIHFFVDERQRVFDVSIEGVSIANHYRGSFDRFLVNKTFDQLLDHLEQRRPADARASSSTTSRG
jgi:phospholipid transport system substrate-binding protein